MSFKANPCTTNPSVTLCLCDSVLKRNAYGGVDVLTQRHGATETRRMMG